MAESHDHTSIEDSKTVFWYLWSTSLVAVEFTVWWRKKMSWSNFFFYIWLEVFPFLESVEEDGDTHLCTACPGGKALWVAVCSTDRWWGGCKCEWQRCEGPSPAPTPSSPSILADRSMMVSAYWAPDGGAARVENKVTKKLVTAIHILCTVYTLHIKQTLLYKSLGLERFCFSTNTFRIHLTVFRWQ